MPIYSTTLPQDFLKLVFQQGGHAPYLRIAYAVVVYARDQAFF